MKSFTNNDVLVAAQKLIETNGSTTTLDVKNELRDQGFWAIQDDVAREMDVLENAGLLVHDDGAASAGWYRTYTNPDPSVVSVATLDLSNPDPVSAKTQADKNPTRTMPDTLLDKLKSMLK